jgi:imidazoleglycerol phosphate dehydratase HisB
MDKVKLKFGDVRKKQIITPNHFVSHMIEHIAWRLGVEVDINWGSENWKEFGKTLGEEIGRNKSKQNSGVAIGMIDDGSAEVKIELDKSGCKFTAINNVDLDWFMALRCEQSNSGVPLVELAEGIADGLDCQINVNICNFEDPHHTWEGVYRGIGIALNKIYTPASENCNCETQTEKDALLGEINILERSIDHAVVTRGTAETGVTVGIDFSQSRSNSFAFNVDPSINIEDIAELLILLAEQTCCTLQVDFAAKALSSSHVVMEDIGFVLGRAFLEIFKLRMEKCGVNGAGSSLQTLDDYDNQSIRIGISIEGRKSWRYVPFKESYQTVQRKLLIGNNVLNTLRSEDLDDFIDGFTCGILASIVIHIKEPQEPTEAWQQIFSRLGAALKEVFAPNKYRKGISPGVKAVLS